WMRSSERSAASDWRAMDADWARQRCIPAGSAAARPAERRLSAAWASMPTTGSSPVAGSRGAAGFEGVGGVEGGDGVHCAPLAGGAGVGRVVGGWGEHGADE